MRPKKHFHYTFAMIYRVSKLVSLTLIHINLIVIKLQRVFKNRKDWCDIFE